MVNSVIMADNEDASYITNITDLKAKLDNIWQPINSSVSLVEKSSLHNFFYANPYAIQPRTILTFDKEDWQSIEQKLPKEYHSRFEDLLKRYFDDDRTRVRYCDAVAFLSGLVSSNTTWAKPCILKYINLLDEKAQNKKHDRDNIATAMNITSLVLGLVSSATTLYGYCASSAPAVVKYVGLGLMLFFAVMTSVIRMANIINRAYAQDEQEELKKTTKAKDNVWMCASGLLKPKPPLKTLEASPVMPEKKQVNEKNGQLPAGPNKAEMPPVGGNGQLNTPNEIPRPLNNRNNPLISLPGNPQLAPT